RHAQPIAGDERLFAADTAPGFGAQGDRPDQRDRDAEAWRLAAGESGDAAQDFGEAQILAAQNVALADPTPLLRQEMTRGDIVDMDDIEAGIDESRHAARRGLDNHAAGRRRLHVAWADRRRRIDNHRRQLALRDERTHRL